MSYPCLNNKYNLVEIVNLKKVEMKQILIVVILLAFIHIAGCKKEEPPLPHESEWTFILKEYGVTIAWPYDTIEGSFLPRVPNVWTVYDINHTEAERICDSAYIYLSPAPWPHDGNYKEIVRTCRYYVYYY